MRATHVVSAAIRDVLAERVRQVDKEGFDEANDDGHVNRELARMAQEYVEQYVGRQWLVEHGAGCTQEYQETPVPDDWPVADKWWKPKSPRQDLVRAAALLIAEIERIDRAANKRNKR